jgi:hypothetical protein
MKCKSCDEVLTDWEATRKVENTGEYLELCNQCFDGYKSLGIDDIYYDQ